MICTTLIIGAKLRGLIFTVVRFELTSHGRSVGVRALLTSVVAIALLVLLRRRRVAGGRRGLAIVGAAGSHGSHCILKQAGIHILIVHHLLMNGWQSVDALR